MLVVLGVISLVVLALLLVPRLRFASPWLGLLTVVIGTFPVFGESATLRNVSLGTALLCGFIGLGVVVASVRLRPVPFVSLGAITVGLFYIASFYAYLLPWGPPWGFHPWMLLLPWPGIGLVVYGVFLWQRHGLVGHMGSMRGTARLALALTAFATLGSAAALAYHIDPPSPGLGNFGVAGPDLPRVVETSPLVIEGTVVGREFQRVKYRRPNGAVGNRLYTLYEVVVSDHWRGSTAGRTLIRVPDFSPIALMPGQRYLLFLPAPAGAEGSPGYSSLTTPQHVWTAEGGSFHPYPGVPYLTSVTRDELVEALAQHPLVTATATGGQFEAAAIAAFVGRAERGSANRSL